MSRLDRPADRLTFRQVDNLLPDACGLKPPIAVGTSPESQFTAWARSEKGLLLSNGIERQLGDLGATEYDVSLVDRYACPYTSPASVAVAAGVPGNRPTASALVLSAGERLRLEVSSRDSKLILILIEAPNPAEFTTLQPLVETILSSLNFTA